jgi:adenine-specific DNA-methyltransferase
VFRKRYASSVQYVRREHEQAYLMAKGEPAERTARIPDVIDWRYTGNRLYPFEKPVESLKPLIRAFSKPSDLVLDAFCGSGSTLVAANFLGRRYVGVELDSTHHRTATGRLADLPASSERQS